MIFGLYFFEIGLISAVVRLNEFKNESFESSLFVIIKNIIKTKGFLYTILKSK